MTDISTTQKKIDSIDQEVEELKKIEETFLNLREHGYLLEDSYPLDPDALRSLIERGEEQVVMAKELEKTINILNQNLSLDGLCEEAKGIILEKITNLTEELESSLKSPSKFKSKEQYGAITFKERSDLHESSLTEPSRVIEGTYTVPRDATVRQLLIDNLGEKEAQLLIQTSDECRESMIDWDMDLKEGQEFKFINLLNSNNMKRDTQEKYYQEVGAELADPLGHTLYRAELIYQIKKTKINGEYIDLTQEADSLKTEVASELGKLAAEEIYQLRYGISRDASGALYVDEDGHLYAIGVERYAGDTNCGLGSPVLESK